MDLCTFRIACVSGMRAHIDRYEYGWNALQKAPVNRPSDGRLVINHRGPGVGLGK